MASLADVFAKIRPDTSTFKGELKSGLGSSAAGVGKETGTSFGKSMMAGFGAVVAAGAVLQFFKGAIAEATEAAKVTRLTEAAIRSTGGAANVSARQISELAGRLSDLSGVDDEVIQSSENVLLTFTQVRNAVGKGNQIFDQAAEAALNLSAALGSDLQGATIQVGKALNDPIAGLTALRKVGVAFTEAQRDQIRTMVEAGDVMGAQKIILKELATEFGGAAEAAASPADKATVAWGNFQEMIGDKILPTLNKVLQFGLDNQDWLAPMAGSVVGLAAVVGTLVVGMKAWNAVQTVLGVGLDGTAVKARRTAVALAAIAVATTALNAAFPGYKTDVEGLNDALDELGKTGKFTGELTRMFGDDLEGLQGDANLAKSSLNGMLQGLEAVVPGLRQLDDAVAGGSATAAAEKFQLIDQTLSDMVRSGNLETARAASYWLMQQTHLTATEFEKLTPQYQNASEAAQRNAGSTKDLADATKTAARAGQDLLKTWHDLHGTMLDADEAMLDAKHAIDDVADAFKSGGKSVQGNSVAVLENRISLERAAESAATAAQRYFDLTGDVDGARRIMGEFQGSAERVTRTTGAQAAAVHDLANKLFALPETVSPNVNVNTRTGGAFTGPLGGIAGTLNNIPRNVNTTVSVNVVQRGSFMGPLGLGFKYGADGGFYRSYASGGMEDHVAQIARGGANRVWAEPETQGEAYIPLALSKRTRSTGILAEVAGKFGYGLVPGGGGSSSRMEKLLEMLLVAVGRIAPGVGSEINGAMRITAQAARAR